MDDSCKEIIKKIAILKKLWPFLRGGLFCFSTLYITLKQPNFEWHAVPQKKNPIIWIQIVKECRSAFDDMFGAEIGQILSPFLEKSTFGLCCFQIE